VTVELSRANGAAMGSVVITGKIEYAMLIFPVLLTFDLVFK
jgi:hypothetical protein